MRNPIQLSPLGFGCAPIMGKVGKSQALRAMSEAFDLGVTHLDVARSYGFGQAEQVVGTFIKERRDKITVTTKFGIVPPHMGIHKRMAIPLARVVTKFFPQINKKIKAQSGRLLSERNFSIAYARKCLDLSLSELATDYIDIYLLHEPDEICMKNKDELCYFLEKSIQAGKIRRWGVAYKSTKDHAWIGNFGADIIQFEGNFQTLPYCSAILNDTRQRIVTRPFIGGIVENQILQIALKDIEFNTLMQKIGASLSDISLCLSHDISGARGTVLCSMFSSSHIKKNVQVLNKFANDCNMMKLISSIKNLRIPVIN